jgi:hypothetical protein
MFVVDDLTANILGGGKACMLCFVVIVNYLLSMTTCIRLDLKSQQN